MASLADGTLGMSMSLSGKPRAIRTLLAMLIVAGLAVLVAANPASSRSQRSASSGAGHQIDDDRPNFVVLMTDDQTYEQLAALPQLRAAMAPSGVEFSNSVVSYPLCCPSRATFLTGQYSQNHGVDSNGTGSDPAEASPGPPPGAVAAQNLVEPEGEFQFHQVEATALPVALSDAGYFTGFIGKYLNGYGSGENGNSPAERVPPGWADWRGLVEPYTSRYWSVHLNIQGTVTDLSGSFQSDVYAAQAEDVLENASASGQPFFLQVSFSAPHASADRNTIYADRDATAYPGATAPRPRSFNEYDTYDKPTFLQDFYAPLTPTDETDIDQFYRSQLRSLRSVDDAAIRIIDRLQALDELQDTVIIFTSDNGLFHGEHRIKGGKFLPYEESIRVPLLLSGPAVAPGVAGTTIDAPVANIDLVPTILDLAGADALASPDGRSLRPLLEGQGERWSVRHDGWAPGPARARPVLLRGTKLVRQDQFPQVAYTGVRSDGWVYVKWKTPGGPQYELYDLDSDPHQLVNRAGDPEVRSVQRRLERQRRLLQSCRGPSCEVAPYGYLDLPRDSALPAWFDAATWADAHSFGAAYADGTFRPDLPIRRLDLLLWLWRHAGAPTTAPDAGVVDVPDPARAAANWAIAEGIVRPSAGGTLDPARPALRRDVLLWLWKYRGRPSAQTDVTLPPDVDPSSPQVAAYRWALEDPPGEAGPLVTLGAPRRLALRDASTRAVAVTALYELDRR